MSSAFPPGGPSRISVSTTSASSRSTMRCAVVDPTNPPPTTVTFFRMNAFSCMSQNGSDIRQEFLPLPSVRFLLCDSKRLHIFDDGAGKLRSAQLRRAFHHPFEVVGDAFLSNGAFDSCFDEFAHFVPAHKFKHHDAGEHHGTRVDHVFVCVLGRCAVRGFKAAVAVTDVSAGRHAEPADLSGAS